LDYGFNLGSPAEKFAMYSETGTIWGVAWNKREKALYSSAFIKQYGDLIMPNVVNTHDPYSGYNFWVEWDGIVHAGFRECSGLTATRKAGTYREGTDKTLTQRQIPGLNSYGNISLKRGITDNQELWNWHKILQDGTADRRNVSIILADDKGQEKMRWNLENCWPTTWNAPDFNATSDEVAIETLELVHEGITVG
jgi:phage tail-like protein